MLKLQLQQEQVPEFLSNKIVYTLFLIIYYIHREYDIENAY
jgi:hypothetical protein